MSLYIRLLNDFWTHRKTLRLQSIAGDVGIAALLRLWSHTAQHQPNGDYSAYDPQDFNLMVSSLIPASSRTQAGGKKELSIVKALQEAGFLDGLKVHDWEEHNGYHSRYAE